MNGIIKIEDTEIQIREYNGQRVVTFKDIDTVHQRPNGTAKRNFQHNKKHFIDGEDYIIVNRDNQKDEIRTFGFSIPSRGITLVTESGYLMLAKSFTDDLSWEVQRQLVNGYFNTIICHSITIYQSYQFTIQATQLYLKIQVFTKEINAE